MMSAKINKFANTKFFINLTSVVDELTFAKKIVNFKLSYRQIFKRSENENVFLIQKRNCLNNRV
jgi:hypothetical protein